MRSLSLGYSLAEAFSGSNRGHILYVHVSVCEPRKLAQG